MQNFIPPCSTDPVFDFSNPVLVSGTANEEGSVYKYTNVIPGVDAIVTLEFISNAEVVAVDDESNDQFWFKPRTNVFDLNNGEEAYQQ